VGPRFRSECRQNGLRLAVDGKFGLRVSPADDASFTLDARFDADANGAAESFSTGDVPLTFATTATP
jgi:hypothetical protein